MLAEGKVDSVTGFSFSSYMNLLRLGVPKEDITTLLMADYGLELYGNAVIVNTDYAKANPDVVKGFLTAVVSGIKDAAADPAAGGEAIVKRNPAGKADFEAERLKLALDANIITDYVLENGIGNIDTERMEKALKQLAITYEFKTEPDMSLYFTDKYLPAVELRKIK